MVAWIFRVCVSHVSATFEQGAFCAVAEGRPLSCSMLFDGRPSLTRLPPVGEGGATLEGPGTVFMYRILSNSFVDLVSKLKERSVVFHILPATTADEAGSADGTSVNSASVMAVASISILNLAQKSNMETVLPLKRPVEESATPSVGSLSLRFSMEQVGNVDVQVNEVHVSGLGNGMYKLRCSLGVEKSAVDSHLMLARLGRAAWVSSMVPRIKFRGTINALATQKLFITPVAVDRSRRETHGTTFCIKLSVLRADLSSTVQKIPFSLECAKTAVKLQGSVQLLELPAFAGRLCQLLQGNLLDQDGTCLIAPDSGASVAKEEMGASALRCDATEPPTLKASSSSVSSPESCASTHRFASEVENVPHTAAQEAALVDTPEVEFPCTREESDSDDTEVSSDADSNHQSEPTPPLVAHEYEIAPSCAVPHCAPPPPDTAPPFDFVPDNEVKPGGLPSRSNDSLGVAETLPIPAEVHVDVSVAERASSSLYSVTRSGEAKDLSDTSQLSGRQGVAVTSKVEEDGVNCSEETEVDELSRREAELRCQLKYLRERMSDIVTSRTVREIADRTRIMNIRREREKLSAQLANLKAFEASLVDLFHEVSEWISHCEEQFSRFTAEHSESRARIDACVAALKLMDIQMGAEIGQDGTRLRVQ
ncbi:hypothetical protein TRVL_01327 [Trypanosoma vivax]|nr:hypothetical protein TRVL_01327 [Trypanosoma vivax]